MVSNYPRESVEFQPVRVTRDGVVVTTGLSFAIVPDGRRPVTFLPAVIIGNDAGVMITGLAAGTYHIYAQLSAGPETPVIDCGYFYID